MGLVKFTSKGDFSKTRKFFNKLIKAEYLNVLEKYGQQGVAALAAATPVDSGLTASSWGYEISHDKNTTTIAWTNSNISSGANVSSSSSAAQQIMKKSGSVRIAILLQYGHGTRNGGYVQGRDFINPAIRPIFDQIATEAWKEVTKL